MFGQEVWMGKAFYGSHGSISDLEAPIYYDFIGFRFWKEEVQIHSVKSCIGLVG